MTTERRTPRTVLTETRARYEELRPSERRIADALLADPEGFATRSIGEIAAAASTSTTTVVRFTRTVGFERFRDLRRALAEQNLRERLAVAAIDVTSSDVSLGDGMEDVVARVAANESLSIADTAAAVDVDALTRAVDAIVRARRVDLFGVGASAIVAVDLQRKLSRIGRVAIEWPEPHAAWTAAAVLDEASVAIAISHSGTTVETVRFLRLAGESGATTVAITNDDASPLAADADVVLRTAAREAAPLRSGALGSRTAQLLLGDCLYLGVAQRDAEAATDALRRTYAAVGRTLPGA
ncbi:MurR/RpiR family transcriptional regulator [Agrococcus sp. SGAir0287]|uniref:MurR/RpiR family transcriptional regulator n=1 Tax=Agrococcus sp. SGAir0287 TaxID=2070347 RepID=UPI0010CD22C1|nr:MurR/RpiR family transcriptional regulator [Agrococcus sp. SGAir0287]QCR19980.1 RpiR family transcriptional regulator [Agrococcus sp. SGAir0287]